MSRIDSLIEGSVKITGIFGYWPSFHDAEVVEVHLWRGDVEPDKGHYVFPVITTKLHVWELTQEVDVRGHLVLRRHTLATLRFHGVDEFRMEGLNHQNAIFALLIEQRKGSDGPSPFFTVQFQPSFGLSAFFTCHRIEVLTAVPQDAV